MNIDDKNLAAAMVSSFMARKPAEVSKELADFLTMTFLTGIGDTVSMFLTLMRNLNQQGKAISVEVLQQLMVRLAEDAAKELADRALVYTAGVNVGD